MSVYTASSHRREGSRPVQRADYCVCTASSHSTRGSRQPERQLCSRSIFSSTVRSRRVQRTDYTVFAQHLLIDERVTARARTDYCVCTASSHRRKDLLSRAAERLLYLHVCAQCLLTRREGLLSRAVPVAP